MNEPVDKIRKDKIVWNITKFNIPCKKIYEIDKLVKICYT